jgi:hypothetical protein
VTDEVVTTWRHTKTCWRPSWGRPWISSTSSSEAA